MRGVLASGTLIAIASTLLLARTISADCELGLLRARRGTLWEGDVVVDDQLKGMYGCDDTREHDSEVRQRANDPRSKDERSSVQSGANMWEFGILPYVIDTDSIDDDGVALVESVISLIENITSIQMPKWTSNDSSLPSLYIRYFRPASGCGYSHIGQLSAKNYGFIYGNPYIGQPVAVNPNCGEDTIFHETMHALGFLHEHSRADRDDYITILYDCITSSAFNNFNKAKSTDHTEYDYQSVMHYSSKAFRDKTKDDCTNTIVALDESNQDLIGSCNYISACDVAGINLAYNDIIDREPSVTCDSTCWCNIDLESVGSTFGIDLYSKLESCGHSSVLSTWGSVTVAESPSPPELSPPPELASGVIDYSVASLGVARPICQDSDENEPIPGQVSCDDANICTDASKSSIAQGQCRKTCGLCSVPMIPFSRTDVAARIAWAFNSDDNIIELYYNSVGPSLDGVSNDETTKHVGSFEGRIICLSNPAVEVVDITDSDPMVEGLAIDTASGGSFITEKTDGDDFPVGPSIIGQLRVLFSSDCSEVSIVDGIVRSNSTASLAHCGTNGIPCHSPQFTLGDINRDSAITIVDIVQMIDIVTGASGQFVSFGYPSNFMTIEQQLLADMNMDEDINVMDVIDLIQIIVQNGE